MICVIAAWTDHKLHREEDLVFTRILIESLDPEAFEYEELLNKHSRRIAIVERRLGLEPGEGSQMASQESWNSALAPQDNAYEIFEDLLSPIANYNTSKSPHVLAFRLQHHMICLWKLRVVTREACTTSCLDSEQSLVSDPKRDQSRLRRMTQRGDCCKSALLHHYLDCASTPAT